MEEMHGARYGGGSSLREPPCQQLSVFTNLEALQICLGSFMMVFLYGHNWLHLWLLVIEFNLQSLFPPWLLGVFQVSYPEGMWGPPAICHHARMQKTLITPEIPAVLETVPGTRERPNIYLLLHFPGFCSFDFTKFCLSLDGNESSLSGCFHNLTFATGVL